MPDQRSRIDKLRAMALQTNSPREAAIAKGMLEALGEEVLPPVEPLQSIRYADARPDKKPVYGTYTRSYSYADARRDFDYYKEMYDILFGAEQRRAHEERVRKQAEAQAAGEQVHRAYPFGAVPTGGFNFSWDEFTPKQEFTGFPPKSDAERRAADEEAERRDKDAEKRQRKERDEWMRKLFGDDE
jgi:hypothetical protein